jgi:hypothetical protein
MRDVTGSVADNVGIGVRVLLDSELDPASLDGGFGEGAGAGAEAPPGSFFLNNFPKISRLRGGTATTTAGGGWGGSAGSFNLVCDERDTPSEDGGVCDASGVTGRLFWLGFG